MSFEMKAWTLLAEWLNKQEEAKLKVKKVWLAKSA